MKFSQMLGGFVIGAAATAMVVVAGAWTPQDEPDAAAMMKAYEEAMAKYATPGPQHEILMKREGTWDAAMKHWMMADGQPMENTGQAFARPLMDGRYLLHEFKSSMPDGSDFFGAMVMGYDLIGKRYESFWIDTGGTGFSHFIGKGGGSDNEIVMKGTMPDPLMGKHVDVKIVERIISDDEYVMEMYQPGMDGKLFKSMEITYTRATE